MNNPVYNFYASQILQDKCNFAKENVVRLTEDVKNRWIRAYATIIVSYFNNLSREDIISNCKDSSGNVFFPVRELLLKNDPNKKTLAELIRDDPNILLNQDAMLNKIMRLSKKDRYRVFDWALDLCASFLDPLFEKASGKAKRIGGPTVRTYDKVLSELKHFLDQVSPNSKNHVSYKRKNEIINKQRALRFHINQLRHLASLRKANDNIDDLLANIVSNMEASGILVKETKDKGRQRTAGRQSKNESAAFDDLLKGIIFTTDRSLSKNAETALLNLSLADFAKNNIPKVDISYIKETDSPTFGILSQGFSRIREQVAQMSDLSKYEKTFKSVKLQGYWFAMYANRKDAQASNEKVATFVVNRDESLNVWKQNVDGLVNSMKQGSAFSVASLKPGPMKTSSVKTGASSTNPVVAKASTVPSKSASSQKVASPSYVSVEQYVLSRKG
ncbi:MAG: hypothetical protein MJZ34_02715 [Paludibacteraceae bacterium]|nr:hypothetical protein [Paludibacteraceae bacterium]